jgi:hypothetical protein
MPDFIKYHESLTLELHALKDRVRNLVKHHPTDGGYKEAALRAMLRRHLPDSFNIGNGFIVTPDGHSTQVDLLITDGSKPNLFRDGDLMIVTPDCVRAIIEVKTSIRGPAELSECSLKLAEAASKCQNCRTRPWVGLFSYDGEGQQPRNYIPAFQQAFDQTGVAIDCFSCGRDHFARHWRSNEVERNSDLDCTRNRWVTYKLVNLASAYFIGNVIDSLVDLKDEASDFAWYSLPEGKSPHRLAFCYRE